MWSFQSCLRWIIVIAAFLSKVAFADVAESNVEIIKQIQINAERYGIAGQSVVVAKNGEVLFRGSTGLANIESKTALRSDHIFPVYSVAKLFASVLVMQLVEQGQLELDEPVVSYLPELPQSWRRISVRQFLNHSSGIPEYFDPSKPFPQSKSAVFAALASQPPLFAAGANSRYTQTNYLVLSEILEKHYGKPYRDLVTERIIQKLGLKHTFLGQNQLPPEAVVAAYTGNNNQLQADVGLDWPEYSIVHSSLYMAPDELLTFLNAVANGELVSKATLHQLWQPQALTNGQRGWFASGWEYGETGDFYHVGHDGGTKVRVRLLLPKQHDGDVYTVIYLTNGSIKNVWSRTLVDSLMAVMAPGQFPAELWSERLIEYAMTPSSDKETEALIRELLGIEAKKGIGLERVINNSGYAIRENLGVDQAIRVFELNTRLFPLSANAWDSLAEAYAAQGNQQKASLLYDKAKQLSTK